MNKQIVAHALQGNIPRIAFLRIENPNGSVVFDGREDGIWTDRELLNAECTIFSGESGFICRLHKPIN
jgi:hypothetical protein